MWSVSAVEKVSVLEHSTFLMIKERVHQSGVRPGGRASRTAGQWQVSAFGRDCHCQTA